MKKRRRIQLISYLLMASILLSFWVCVAGCETVEADCGTYLSVSDNSHVENANEDFCSIQTAPSAVFSNQKSIVPTNLSLLPNQFRRLNIQSSDAENLSHRNEKTFVRLPLQILRQLRI